MTNVLPKFHNSEEKWNFKCRRRRSFGNSRHSITNSRRVVCGVFVALSSRQQQQQNCCLLDFLPENVPHFEQSREKPEKTCGNRRKSVDKAPGKAEGELRYGSPHPHEY